MSSGISPSQRSWEREWNEAWQQWGESPITEPAASGPAPDECVTNALHKVQDPFAANDCPVAEKIQKDAYRASGNDLRRQRCLRGLGGGHKRHVKGRKKQNGSTTKSFKNPRKLRPPTVGHTVHPRENPNP